MKTAVKQAKNDKKTINQREYAWLIGHSEAFVRTLCRFNILDTVRRTPFPRELETTAEKRAEIVAICEERDGPPRERKCSQKLFGELCRISAPMVNRLVKSGAIEVDPKERSVLLERETTRQTMRHYFEVNASKIRAEPHGLDGLFWMHIE